MKLLDDVKTRRFFIPVIIFFLVDAGQIAKIVIQYNIIY